MPGASLVKRRILKIPASLRAHRPAARPGIRLFLSPILAARVELLVSPEPHHGGSHSRAVYRVTRSFVASSWEDGRFLTVRKGALLAIETPLKQFGLIKAVWAEQTLLVFTRDIEACAEPLAQSRTASETI